jgi:hypothetical protein
MRASFNPSQYRNKMAEPDRRAEISCTDCGIPVPKPYIEITKQVHQLPTEFTVFQKTCEKCGAPTEKHIRDRYVAYIEVVRAYRAEDARLSRLFKQDALAAIGFSAHPKAERIFEMAVSRGGEGDLYGIFAELCDLADLLKD